MCSCICAVDLSVFFAVVVFYISHSQHYLKPSAQLESVRVCVCVCVLLGPLLCVYFVDASIISGFCFASCSYNTALLLFSYIVVIVLHYSQTIYAVCG